MESTTTISEYFQRYEYPGESDMKSSCAAYRAHIAFGNGAKTYVATTRRGNQFENSAHDRMTRRNPHANLYTSDEIL